MPSGDIGSATISIEEPKGYFSWNRRPLTMASGDTPPGIRRVVQQPRHPWLRRAPAFVADLSGGQVGHSLPAAKLVRHATFRSTMPRCLLFGTHHFHPVLQEDGQLSLHDTDPDRMAWRVNYYLSTQAGRPPPGPRIEAAEGGFVCTTEHLSPADATRIDGPVFFASPVEPDNFGMWVLMGLPSAHDYLRIAKGEKYLCWMRSDWQRNLLGFMGLNTGQVIVQEPYRLYLCDELTMHQYSHIDVTPTPSDLAVYAELRARCLASAAARADKIYISRRSFARRAGYRQLLNEDELIAAMEEQGFLIVEPETLDFSTQISLFARARAVVGVGGAGMFNAVFCQPGTAVVSIESSQAFIYGHANLFVTAGLDYGFIFGRQDETDATPVHKRWTVDVGEAVRYIKAFV